MNTLMAALLAIIGPAHEPNGGLWDPPARYTGEYQGGTLIELGISPESVREFCAPDLAYAVFGCSLSNPDGSCTIVYIDRTVNGVTPMAVRRHELGHCNGWPSNHPA
jgi:hypothetical protein